MATAAAKVPAASGGFMNRARTLLNTAGSSISEKVFNRKFFVIIILIAIFVAVAVYVYNTYISPRINPDYVPNAEWNSTEETDVATMYLFTVDWCPYSKQAVPIWGKFKNKINNNLINGVQLNFVEIDGEKNSKALEKIRRTIPWRKKNRRIPYYLFS